MIGVLCCLAGAAVCWPRAGVAARGARLRARPLRPGTAELALLADRPVTAVLATLTGAAGTALVSTPVVACLAGVGAGLGMRAVQRHRRTAAARRGVQALVEALGVLAAELRAGRAVGEAAGAAVAGCPDPGVAAALGPVLRLGELPAGALARPSDAQAAQALTAVAAAVRLSARTGCSLAGVVTAVEDDLRARARAETELRAAVAGPRASAAVLAGLPVLGLLMGSGVGADPWRVLTTTGTGTVLLVAGVGLEVTGVAWSSQLVRRAVQR